MRRPNLRRLAPWGGTLALCLSYAGLALAQSGQPPTGPPVDRPSTNQNAPNPTTPGQTSPGTSPRPKSTGEILPAVPETARDPAPPGTRGVRVDVPKTGTAPAPGPAASSRRPSNILVAEGVVTRLDRAGKNINGELERFAFDPSQDWESYVSRGATGVPEKDEERPKTNDQIKDANAKQHEESADKPNVLEMVITKRSYVYTHARSEDGTDQYGVTTSSSPDTTSSQSGQVNRPAGPPPTQPVRTNFTNIKEGSFVAVRYRKAGDLNEVLNLTLIEMPMNQGGAGSPSTPARPGQSNTPATGTGAGAGTGTAPSGAPGTAPAGTPTVPTTPVGPALPR